MVKETKRGGASVDYAQTSIGQLPSDWEVRPLGELFSFSGGLSASREQLSDAGLCYLHYGDIHNSRRAYIDVKREYASIPKLNVPIKAVLKKSLLEDGDVVFVDASEDDEGASRHVVVRNPESIPFISGLHTIVAKDKGYSIEDRYKEYCFQSESVRSQFKFYAVGTKVTGISKTNIPKILIARPPKPEQRAISEVLSDVDQLINECEVLIAKKEAIKKGALQVLMTGRRRLPGFSGAWKVMRLRQILKVRHGKSQKGVVSEMGQYPILASGGIIGRAREFLYNQPSVLIGRKGTIDFPQYMDSPFWSVDTLFYTEIREEQDAKFIYYLFQLINWRSYNEASGVPSLNARTIESIAVLIPTDRAEQVSIASVISDMESEIGMAEELLAKCRLLKIGLLQSLLTGKIRVYETGN